MADSTLSAIRIKVRRLTRSPSAAQVTDADINEYINTFIEYDFPEQLRLFSLKTTVTFYCQPYQDTYRTDAWIPAALDNPLYNFKNKYISVHPPLYIAGNQAMFSQSRDQFYALYPFVNQINTITNGDGVTTAFNGVLTGAPVLAGSVVFAATEAVTNAGITFKDEPVFPWDGTGQLTNTDTGAAGGVVNYVTGVWNLDFAPNIPANDVKITSQTVPYQPSRPQSMLYYNDKFVLRPVPDQPYAVNFEAYARPTQLLAAVDIPELEQWWQYIAYGAAIKLLQDRLEFDTVNLLMSEFKQQELFVLRRTLNQQKNSRTATIYTESISAGYGQGFGWGPGMF